MTSFLTLKRIAQTKYGVFGTLHDFNGIPFAVTLEREWKDNERDKSCIPAGDYLCARTDSPKFGRVFELTGVRDRSHILIHKGNLLKDTTGCILVGEKFEPLEGKPAVLSSGDAFQELMEEKLKGVLSFWLSVRWRE